MNIPILGFIWLMAPYRLIASASFGTRPTHCGAQIQPSKMRNAVLDVGAISCCAHDAKLCGIYEPPGAMNIPILGYICLMPTSAVRFIFRLVPINHPKPKELTILGLFSLLQVTAEKAAPGYVSSLSAASDTALPFLPPLEVGGENRRRSPLAQATTEKNPRLRVVDLCCLLCRCPLSGASRPRRLRSHRLNWMSLL